MSENLTGLVKILGIFVLLVALWIVLAIFASENFLKFSNIENLLRRTALFGILGIGVAFVIISSGIDLSIGSLVCLSGVLFAMLIEVNYAPMEQVPVWQINKDSGIKVLVQQDEFSEGDSVWLYRDRKTNGLLKVTGKESVTVSGANYTQLTLEGRLRGPATEGIEKSGFLSPTYPFEQSAPESVHVESNVKLKPRDKVRFVHATKSSKVRAIKSWSDQGDLTLESGVDGIKQGYRAVPIQRNPRMSIPLALFLVLLFATLLGLLHGWLVTRLNQQPFIVTLCGLLIYRGVARFLANDQPKGFIEYSDTLGMIATGRHVIFGFGIPYAFYVLLVVAALAIVLLNFTVWGRYLMALGRNEEAALYSGINTKFVKVGAYVLCAVLTAVGGMMFAIDSNSVPPSSFGNFYELYAIAAAVLGGCSLRGGEGSIIGVIIGTALMQTLYNMIVLLGIPNTLEFTIIGAVILFGVVADELVRKSVGRRRRSD